jgi:hypothetical protein
MRRAPPHNSELQVKSQREKPQKNFNNNCKNVFDGRYSLTFEDLRAMFADY